eukprot:scaffold6240_cov59-Attheya_sp.AAC.1
MFDGSSPWCRPKRGRDWEDVTNYALLPPTPISPSPPSFSTVVGQRNERRERSFNPLPVISQTEDEMEDDSSSASGSYNMEWSGPPTMKRPCRRSFLTTVPELFCSSTHDIDDESVMTQHDDPMGAPLHTANASAQSPSLDGWLQRQQRVSASPSNYQPAGVSTSSSVSVSVSERCVDTACHVCHASEGSSGISPTAVASSKSLLSYFSSTPKASSSSSSTCAFSFSSTTLPLSHGNARQFGSCTHCERRACVSSCSRTCESCRLVFCSFCSTVNYDQHTDRIFCLDCNDTIHQTTSVPVSSSPSFSCMMEE